MRTRFLVNAVALSAALLIAGNVPTIAQKMAQPLQVKVGYFNLALVKASYPEAAGSDMLKTQAENQLRRDVDEGNKRLRKAEDDKKPKEEIERMARDLQAEINAKQQALIQLLQTQAAIANQNIAQAVASVAKDRNLDLVVDGASIFAGGDKIVKDGEDITEAVVKRLQPQTIKPSGGSASDSGTRPAVTK
jgi:Skp family chaperone for outer membrane proteins